MLRALSLSLSLSLIHTHTSTHAHTHNTHTHTHTHKKHTHIHTHPHAHTHNRWVRPEELLPLDGRAADPDAAPPCSPLVIVLAGELLQVAPSLSLFRV